MKPAALHVALLALALAGCIAAALTPAAVAVACTAIAGLVAYEWLRARTEWAAIDKLARESAAALLKLEARLNAIERGVKALVE